MTAGRQTSPRRLGVHPSIGLATRSGGQELQSVGVYNQPPKRWTKLCFNSIVLPHVEFLFTSGGVSLSIGERTCLLDLA